jgi:hypothetical protein
VDCATLVAVRVAVSVALFLTGCFYIDPIRSPSHVVVIPPPDNTAYRGSVITLKAAYTTENQPESQRWLVFACSRFPDGCDQTESYHLTDPVAQVPVPVHTLADPEKLVEAIAVTYDVRDDHGALASASASIRVLDGPPTLELGDPRPVRSLTVGAPIDLFATYSDIDNSLDDIVLDWEPVPPSTPGMFTLEDLPVPPPSDPAHASSRTVGKRLFPKEPGVWDVKVTAQYRPGISPDISLSQHKSFTVNPDQPP